MLENRHSAIPLLPIDLDFFFVCPSFACSKNVLPILKNFSSVLFDIIILEVSYDHWKIYLVKFFCVITFCVVYLVVLKH